MASVGDAQNFANGRQFAVWLGEGWHVPRALLPARGKRVLLLIDPPFEQADELQRCVGALNEAIGRMRQSVVVWYPIKDERQLRRFYRDMQGSHAPKLLRVELLVHQSDEAQRLNGSTAPGY